MNPTTALHDLGQSLWLDNITRDLITSGTLQAHIDKLAVTGLTSNPTIFDHAIRKSTAYDADIARLGPSARSKEDLFFSLAIADLTRAAELFQPVFARTDGVDGWVSLELSPLLAYDTERSVVAARETSIVERANPISSSRFPAPGKAFPPSRRRPSRAFRST
ncbi:MAG: transaldolase family protein [Xanthobacteraceae bacterium]